MRMMEKIIYDIKFPLYYNGKRREFIINIEAQKSSKKSKLGYQLENRIAYYMGRMISEQKGTEFVNSNYDDLKSVYTIWICMDTKKIRGLNNRIWDEIQPDLW